MPPPPAPLPVLDADVVAALAVDPPTPLVVPLEVLAPDEAASVDGVDPPTPLVVPLEVPALDEVVSVDGIPLVELQATSPRPMATRRERVNEQRMLERYHEGGLDVNLRGGAEGSPLIRRRSMCS